MKPINFLSRALVFAAVALIGMKGSLPAHAQTTPSNLQLLDQAIQKSQNSDRVAIDDMIFPRERFVAYRNSVAAPKTSVTRSALYNVPRWTGGNVYYSFDAGLPSVQRTAFVDACREWEKYVNLRFVPRTTQSNYIRVYQDAGGGSFSYIGMVGGAQDMSLATWADKWTACHEIEHALGGMHEQCRSDRDNFVSINFSNIESSSASNFAIVSDSINRGAYDFDSVMHYHDTSFAIDSSVRTIVCKPAYAAYQDAMGQRDHLSALDKAGMVAIYGAPGTVVTRPANDAFAGAAALSSTSASLSGTNVNATKEAGEPDHAGDDGDATVWYRWRAPAGGTAAFSTSGSNFDTTLAVYTGTSVGALTNIVSNDDENSSITTSFVSWNAVAGTTYSIAVNGYKEGTTATKTGNITLTWSAPVAPVSYSLSGAVTQNGTALSGVSLSLSGGRTTTSGSNGAFTFSGVAAGTYTLSPSKAGFVFSPASRSISLSSNVTGANFAATPVTTSQPVISVSSVNAAEGNAGGQYMTFNVTLSEPSTQPVTVNFATVNGTALAGSDYNGRTGTGTITFSAGVTVFDVRVFLLPDRVVEANETFSLVLSNPVGATLGIGTGRGTILNDDRTSDARIENAPASDENDPSASKG